jgi:hypothetical protein
VSGRDIGDPSPGAMSKAERLALAGAIAPILRDQGQDAFERRVTLLDKDGKVVGYRTLAEVQMGLLRRKQIEFEVADGVRPTKVVCEQCGKLFAPRPGKLRKVCPDGCNVQCPGFGETEGSCQARSPRNAFQPAVIKARKGRAWMCKPCGIRKMYADPAERTKRTKARRKNKTWRKNVAAATSARSRTPEWRAANKERAQRRASDPQWREDNARRLERAREAKAKRTTKVRGEGQGTKGLGK